MKKSATTCENGKFGCVGTEGVGGGWDGAVRCCWLIFRNELLLILKDELLLILKNDSQF